MTSETGYKNLVAWVFADELASEVYRITVKFPRSEMFGLTSQLRQAALSVPANIVEGYARNNKKEFKRFLGIALGSLAEVGYFLDFAYKQRLIPENEYAKVSELRRRGGQLLWKLYKSL